jgi:catechol 2,3-dioxygenase-like lactoylglutathione lyase family enzyme
MPNLQSVEIKAFVPAKDFQRSIDFYQAIGFTLASKGGGIAYFHHGACSFLLQDFCEPQLAANFMMHWLVENVDDWYQHILASGVAERFGVRIEAPQNQPWAMRDFVVFDPSGVLWRVAQNIPRKP